MHFCMFHLETILKFIWFLMGDQFSDKSYATVISAFVKKIYNFKKMNFVDPLAFAKTLCYIFMRTGTFISKFCHMLYFNINILWTGRLYSHALCFCHFLAIFSYISISIGSEEELNVVSSCIYRTTLKCSREHNQEKVFDVLKRVTLYRFSTKIRYI